MSEMKTYEVLAPVRLYRRSRGVGAIVHAHPEDVRDLVGTTLRELAEDDSGADQGGEGTSGSAAALAGTAPPPSDGHAPTAPPQEGREVTSGAAAPATADVAAKPALAASEPAAQAQKSRTARAKPAATKGKGRR
ncbi:hypothetical protein O4A46_24725 [Cupriavidus gilardii]|uniref:hypothetical protein n=1 Tax=Cupriavidus gilardii TaxID=82541 RepID=UPI00352EEF2E